MKNPRNTLEQRRRLRREMTKAELAFWEGVRAGKIEDVKFRRQYGVGPYIIDFFIPSQNIAIEVDGSIHNLPRVQENDRNKDAFLKNNGIKVIRFSNEQVLNELDTIIEELKTILEKSP